MENHNQAFKAISRICLNNWHYIDQKILGMNQEINFFTGHSGSGKSTVIDAIQIVLYANTDGRSFFNKAAADDSDRNLIEYLRGMINISENNQATYKRNQNFSTTIVLELEQTQTKEKECVGVVFDVETATNEVNRLFFYHKGELFENGYRANGRAMAISEIRDTLKRDYGKEDIFYTSNNERYRRNLYEIYLGGLDMEKFPKLFKRAIPFKMNIRLEDFVKEYICMEQDLAMEDMQESVILYGRMCRRIDRAMEEARELEEICAQHQNFLKQQEAADLWRYYGDALTILAMKQSLEEMKIRVEEKKKDIISGEASLQELEEKKQGLEQKYMEISRQVIGSGYEELEEKYNHLQETIQLLEKEERRWKERSTALAQWEEEEITTNQMLWDIEKFQDGSINGEEIARLKKSLKEVQKETEKARQEATSESRSLKKEAHSIESDLLELKMGKKAYPRYLEDARYEITRQLFDKTGKKVQVRILADLIDIKHETWRNAVEGYLGNHKLALMVEPKYIREAMEIYETLDEKKYFRVSLVDTEKIMAQEHKTAEKSLAEEVSATENYVKAFIAHLLSNVRKCDSLEELRECRVGITPDCMLYQNFQLRRLDPGSYTERAFIGDKSTRQRQKELTSRLEELNTKITEYEAVAEDARRILGFEYLMDATEDYQQMFEQLHQRKSKEEQASKLWERMEAIGADSVDLLKLQLEEVRNAQKTLETEIDRFKYRIHDSRNEIEQSSQQYLNTSEELADKEKNLKGSKVQEEQFAEYVTSMRTQAYEQQIRKSAAMMFEANEKVQKEKDKLSELRTAYLKNHPNRPFSATEDSNLEYEKLKQELECGDIEDYRKKANVQAKAAVEHFKEDFIYKIRSAIKEAYVRRDELNRIIRNLNFGKDRYQFKITRNHGSDGAYYDMFMDEDLEIDPSTLSASMDHQMNLFSMGHENKYAALMNDLIHIFIPPEEATALEMEEARLNMEKYADYRTYLSFEMEQIVEGDEELVIGLSKMIKKNSGGEGQNPLYVALLASFAQAYHVHLSPKLARRPSIRLVVLDEAFSKMDAEKVASCIELIRGLGFQAIISATNDKIQNYLENVDKTFVYANPNKKSISIQEFEKKEFQHLSQED